MKKIMVLIVLVIVLVGASSVFACEDAPEPQGEQCARCSNIFDGWVEWYDRDGGCDNDWWNDRVEYPGDARCVVPEPTPDPTPEPTQCVWMQYVLIDTEGHQCYIKRNFERGDQPGSLPKEYRNTRLMRNICSETCTGKKIPEFGELDRFHVTCAVCDGACK